MFSSISRVVLGIVALTVILSISLLCSVAFSKTIVLTDKNVVVMRQAFNSNSVALVQQQMFEKAAKEKEMYLFLRTPGGSISAGQTLIDSFNSLPNKIHTITNFAASMGYNTVQLLKGKRYILPSGILMSHRAYGGFEGQIPGELNTQLNFFMGMMDAKDANIAKRIGITLEKYKALVWDEFWTYGEQAVRLKHADEVVDVRCDKSLNGTITETFSTFFGPVDVIFSKCPVITGPLGVSFKALKLNRNNVVENEKFKEIENFFDLYFNNLTSLTKSFILTNKIQTVLK